MSQPSSRTRTDLHAVAEVVLAGPQHRTSGTIRLRPLPGGFGTVAEPDLRVEGDCLVVAAAHGRGERRIRLDGVRLDDLAEAAGVRGGAPQGVYQDTTGADDDHLVHVDDGEARHLAAWLALADGALRRFAPDLTPVLWPEHFDLGIGVDEVNYGVSPGDSSSPQPYAYVGPWAARTGQFWNAPFGATRPASELADEDALLAFFQEGRAQAATAP